MHIKMLKKKHLNCSKALLQTQYGKNKKNRFKEIFFENRNIYVFFVAVYFKKIKLERTNSGSHERKYI